MGWLDFLGGNKSQNAGQYSGEVVDEEAIVLKAETKKLEDVSAERLGHLAFEAFAEGDIVMNENEDIDMASSYYARASALAHLAILKSQIEAKK